MLALLFIHICFMLFDTYNFNRVWGYLMPQNSKHPCSMPFSSQLTLSLNEEVIQSQYIMASEDKAVFPDLTPNTVYIVNSNVTLINGSSQEEIFLSPVSAVTGKSAPALSRGCSCNITVLLFF